MFVKRSTRVEVPVRISKEANSSHAVAANLSELELKSPNWTRWKLTFLSKADIQRRYMDLVEAYEVTRSYQELKQVFQDDQAKKEVNHSSDCSKNLREITSTVMHGIIKDISKWIEDLVPNSMWSQTVVKYDKFALWGISHWGKKRRQFYAFATLRESARDVYSKRRIIAVTKVEIVEWHDYKHLDWITVRRDDDALYKKSDYLSVEEVLHLMFLTDVYTKSLSSNDVWKIFQRGVESYQKKLNLTKPDTYRSNLRRQDAYTPYSDPRGFIYENKDKKNRLMRIDELHKFSDGTLDDVRTVLNDRLKGIRMEYLPETFWSQVAWQREKHDPGD
ncbi:hypothetical protein Tco_0770465 [Tanacetum coccineum]|uniref:Uncharacterized protein n=1 Tax=Tanacetum coccineum TaxID=301880 RepID=A0ABQ4ZCA4_9ASTR